MPQYRYTIDSFANLISLYDVKVYTFIHVCINICVFYICIKIYTIYLFLTSKSQNVISRFASNE